MNSSARSWTVVRSTWLNRKPSAQAWFLTAWTTVFVIFSSIAYWKNWLNAGSWMSASPELVFQKHEWWRLWTTLLAHGDAGHLASNSLLLIVLGYFLSGYFGAWVFPTLALLVGGITNAIVLTGYPSQVHLIGISGVVYWLGGAWLVLYFLIDQRRTYLQRALRSFGVALGVFMPASAFDPQISYQAHFVGFIMGVLSGAAIYLLQRKKFLAELVTEEIFEEDMPQAFNPELKAKDPQDEDPFLN